jgi:hypothetical protein
MADNKGAEGSSFLARWSERKRQAGEAAQEEPDEFTAGQGDSAASAQAAAAEAEPVDPATLPDIDSLRADSDFTVFMRAGVPEALKQRALRRLWQVDPTFNVICPLDDYNLDYTDAATVVPNLKTLYQVGRGMVLPEAVPEPPPVTAAGPVEPAEPLPPAPSEEDPDELAGPAPGPGATAGPPAGPTGLDVANRETAPTEAGVRPAAGSARRRRWGDFDS